MTDLEIDRIGKILGWNTRHLMNNRGVTQTELANRIGVSQPTIASICQGYGCKTAMWTIFAIADEFDLSVDELCREEFNYD